MSMRRITITIPPEVLEAAEIEAAKQGMSVSAWLSQAAAHAAKIAAGLADTQDVLAEIGGVDENAVAEARAALERLRVRGRAETSSRTSSVA